jgi:ribose transport system ATP-binding protein
VAELRQVDRALLAIARAFLDVTEHLGEPQGRGVLILDEPTAFLPAADVERLFSAVHRAAAEGTGVIYISHRTEEILELTDSVSVLRDGVLVRTAQTGELDQTQLVELILGEQLENFYPHLSSPSNREALVVSGLSGDLVHEVSLSLNEGEIVGVTGINGAGYEELPYLLFGATPPRSGTISIKGRRELAVGFAPRRAIRGGLALLPADRQSLSGAQELTVFENVSLPLLRRFIKFGRISRRQERAAVETVLRDYAVKPPDGKALLRQLSGGNQQKALLGKWLQLQPSVLLLHEPTQGVDVGAKKEIFGRIEQAAAEGAAVLVASSEYEDLAHLCHRVVVLRDGRVTAELIGGELTEENIVREAYGSERGGASDRLVVAGVGTAGGNNER